MEPSEIRPFVITGTQRVGSGAIARGLGRHACVACGRQWPERVSWFRRVEACRRAVAGDFTWLSPEHQVHMRSLRSDETAWIGYRGLFRANDKWVMSPAMAPSLWLDRMRDTVSWWRADASLHVIHIVRTDNLAWLRSKVIARVMKAFKAGERYRDDVSVTVSVSAALRRVVMKEWLDATLSTLAMGGRYHLVRYEDLLSNPSGVVAAAQRFLGLEPQVPVAGAEQERQSAGIAVEQHIGNYDELRCALDGANLLTAAFPPSADYAAS